MSALAKAREGAELDKIFGARIECLGYQSAGYLRVFGEASSTRPNSFSVAPLRVGPSDTRLSNTQWTTGP